MSKAGILDQDQAKAQFAVQRRSLYVIQHTDSEYLGLIEDHLEGRSIGFTYMRPHTPGGKAR